MSRATITEAAASMYLALHNIVKQVEAGCQPMDVDLMAAHQSLGMADQVKALYGLLYSPSDEEKEADDLALEDKGFGSIIELPSITAEQAEEKKWSLPL